MTYPLTPREKVAALKTNDPTNPAHRLAKDLQAGHFAAGEARDDLIEVLSNLPRYAALASSGDHAELARLAEAATPGEWELDGHQCLSAPDGTIVVDYSCCSRGEWEANAAYLRAVQPSRVLALIAEVATLRGDLEKSEADRIRGVDDRMSWTRRALEAERKLAEAVGLLEPFAKLADEEGGYREDDRLAWGLNAADINWGDLRAARTFLSKEAERG